MDIKKYRSKTVEMSIRVDENYRDRVRKLSEDSGYSMAEIVRQDIEKGMGGKLSETTSQKMSEDYPMSMLEKISDIFEEIYTGRSISDADYYYINQYRDWLKKIKA